MALRLKIVSDNAAAAGEHARWTFGVNGGRIGRHTSNDWVLRDPERYVSGRHAEIEHRGGTWLLRDTSTNGTFVNDSDEALGPGPPAPALAMATDSASASTRSRSRSPAATISRRRSPRRSATPTSTPRSR